MINNPASSGGLANEISYAIGQMESLKVTELKEVCRSIGLPLTGRKVNLQDRITLYLKESMSIGHIDPWRPKTIVLLISLIRNGDHVPQYFDIWSEVKGGKYPGTIVQIMDRVSGNSNNNTSNHATPHKQKTNEHNNNPLVNATPRNITLNDTVPFKLSPFYKLQILVPKSSYRLVQASGRGVGAVRFTFSGHEWLKLEDSSKKYKLCLFCWPAQASQYQKEFISFPSPNEILFNGNKITENVKGLKNKPGTAKPADLTSHILPPPRINTLDLIYAYTKMDYQMACYVVEIISPENLVQNVVLKHPRISKKTTLNYIKKTMNEEDEDELVTTSTVLSLQCPISYTRMKYPAQSKHCKHLQCFDAVWYLHSQMQVPTWQCPVCSIKIPLESLVISEYVDEILKTSNEDIEQVELSPDGSWKPFFEEETPVPTHNASGHNNITQERSESPVKKEIGNSSMNEIPLHHDEPLVISLDSSDEEEEDEREVVPLPVGGVSTLPQSITSGTPTVPTPSQISPTVPTPVRPISNTTNFVHTSIPTNNSSDPFAIIRGPNPLISNVNRVERNDSAEADLPLSQYIRRNPNESPTAISVPTRNTSSTQIPLPSLASESLLGLGNSNQNRRSSNPTPSSVSNQQGTTPGSLQNISLPHLVPGNPPRIQTSSEISQGPSPLGNFFSNNVNNNNNNNNSNNTNNGNNNNGNNNILGIGGNLPSLNLPQPQVNPFFNNNNAPINTPGFNNNGSSSSGSSGSLPPLTNMVRRASSNDVRASNVNTGMTSNNQPISTQPVATSNNNTSRKIAVPHSKPNNARRNKSDISPFIPRKPYPPSNLLPRKRPELHNSHTEGANSLENGNNYGNNNVRINPITNRPSLIENMDNNNGNPGRSTKENRDMTRNFQLNASQPTAQKSNNTTSIGYPTQVNNDSDVIDLTSD